MKIAPETALAAWAVGTAWLVLFVILEHFDEEGPDLVDYVQWASLLVAVVFYPSFRKWFAAWLKRQKGSGT
jgi:hypothetical protein